MPAITRQELETLLTKHPGAVMCTITAETVPKMRKTNNPWFGRITKVAVVNGVINWIYEKSVNRQREREGHPEVFFAVERMWGVRLTGTPFVEHKDKKYLELKVEKSVEYKYRDEDGNDVPASEINPFLYTSKSKRQETEKEILLRDYALDSITQVAIDGENYWVEN